MSDTHAQYSTAGEVGAWYWHVHHEVPCEPLTEPLQNRIRYIKSGKPADEIETRLRLLTPVKGAIPPKIFKAGVACNEARAAYNEAGAALNKAWAVYYKALSEAQPELEALHAIEHPDCPWDGRTIFPEVTE